MNTVLVIGIIVIVLAGAGAAVYLSTMNNGGGSTETTPTTTSPQTTQTTRTAQQGGGGGSATTTSGSSTGSVNITGAWYGTYTTSSGATGRWAWRIWSTGPDTYKGLLVTTEPYSSGGSIPISITLDGNRIRIGAVSVGVVFTGTITGDTMSGTWKFTNGMDQGPWSGQRGVTDITPGEQSTTRTGSQASSTTTTSPSDQLMGVEPYDTILLDVKSVVKDVFGSATITWSGLTGSKASAVITLGSTVTGSADEKNTIITGLREKGYNDTRLAVSGGYYVVMTYRVFDDVNYTIYVMLQVGTNQAGVSIQGS